MKKVSLLLCLFLAGTSSIFAQEDWGVSTEAGRKATFARNGFWDNWFLGAGAGATIFMGGQNNNADLKDRFTVNPVGMIGKWFNPYLGGRLAGQAGRLHGFSGKNGERMYSRTHMNIHADFMFNFTNYISKYNEKRLYNFIPTIGFGYEHAGVTKFFKRGLNGFTINASLLNTFRLSDRVSLFAEVGGYFVESRFNPAPPSRGKVWNGIMTGSAGLMLKVGKVGFSEATLMDPSLIKELNDQINRLKADNSRMAQQLPCPECPKPKPCPEVTTPVQPNVELNNVVFFRINSANIDKNQEISIYNTAEYLKKNPNASVKVVGYADKQTGSANYNMKLSEKRARNVAKALIEKYNINSNRVKVEWKGSSEQPYKENAWNRVAIFFAE